MKIAIDARVLMDGQYSGVPEYVYNLISSLVAIDQQNKYLLFYNSARDVEMPDFQASNLRYIRRQIPNKLLNYGLFKTLDYPSIEKLLGEKIDLWFMPHLNFIAKNSTTPSVLTVHDLSFLRYPEFFSMRKNIWHRAINAKALVNSFDKVVAVSEQTKRDLIDLTGVASEKISVIYGAASAEFKVLAKDDQVLQSTKEKFNLPARFILSLGTIEPRKNLLALIKAYESMRAQNPDLADVQLIIAGGSGWNSAAIYKAIATSPYRQDIKLLGYVDRSDKVALYNLASVLAFPSLYEGFGIPPLEAMACGCPVVASWGTSLAEVIGEAGLLIDPYDINDLSAALTQVLQNNALADQLSRLGGLQASKFSWQRSAEAYLKLFKISQ